MKMCFYQCHLSTSITFYKFTHRRCQSNIYDKDLEIIGAEDLKP